MLSLSQSVSTPSNSTMFFDDYQHLLSTVEDTDNVLHLPITNNANSSDHHDQKKIKQYKKRAESTNEPAKPKKQETNSLLCFSHIKPYPQQNSLNKKKKNKKQPLMTRKNRFKSSSNKKPIFEIMKRRQKTLERNTITNMKNVQKSNKKSRISPNKVSQSQKNIDLSLEKCSNNLYMLSPTYSSTDMLPDVHIVDDDNYYCRNDAILY